MHNITSPCADDSVIEHEIKSKGLTAPRVTPEPICLPYDPGTDSSKPSSESSGTAS